MKNSLYYIIIGLVLFIVFQKQCGSGTVQPSQPDTITVVKIKIDTIKFAPPIYTPIPISVSPGEFLTIPLETDTAAILFDYFSSIPYCDTIINDSSAFIVLMDTISRNRIKSREIVAKVYKKTVSEVSTITKPAKLRNKLFLGMGLGRSPESFGFTGNFMIVNKKENAFTFSYDVINKDFYVTFYWKLRWRR